MVAIFTGLGAGAERGSGNVLGNAGLLGSGTLGRGNGQVLLNAATGNLMIQGQDEMLIGRGPDAAIGRTYNSLGDLSDDNGDNWRMSTDRRVYGLTGTVNTAGSTVKRVSADGSDITYTWNAGAAAYVATDGNGAYDRLSWAAGTSTWTWTDGDSQATEAYGYAAGSGRYLITNATDTKNNTLTFTYLTGGKLNRVTTADGGYTQYGWSGNNITLITTGYTDLATSTAKTLTRTRYGYDGSNRLTSVTVDLSPGDNSVTDGKTYVTTYTYDGTSKRVASITQTDGSALAITYDTSGRVKTLAQTAASGITRTTTLTYQTGYTTVTDPIGQVTRLDYDASGQLTKITAPAAVVGAAQQVTQFAYNANGDVTSVIDPLGSTTSYSAFTATGLAGTVTDRLGAVTSRTFGAKNELLTETTTGADQSGAAVQHTTRYVYDASNRVRFELSAAGNVIEHRYDDANGGVETATLSYTGNFHDLAGLSATQTPTLAQMTTWASAADQTAVAKRTYTYDARGNLTASYGYGTLDAAGAGAAQGGTFYTYDQAGQLLSTNGYQQAAQTYAYDGMGRITASVDLDGGTTSIVFNDAATSTVVTLASGLVQTSTYNKAGELISLAESGANTTVGTASTKYDALGRMRMTTDATGHNRYAIYDKAGRKTADIDHYGMLTEYRYDANNRVVATVTYTGFVTAANLTTLADPASAIEVATLRPTANAKDMWAWRVYDKEDRVIEAIDGTGRATKYEYDASGHLVRTTWYNKLLSASTITGFKTNPPTTLNTPAVDAANDRVARTFYDKAGRVVGSLDGEGFLARIDYDAGGRKIAETTFAAATTAANRASGTFATLASGLANAAADRVTRSVYDGQGLLVFRVDALNQVTEYVYPAADAADVTGLVRRSIAYAGPIAAPSAWTVAGVRSALNNANLGTNANNRSSWAVYNNRQQLAYAIDSMGGVTGYKYDSSGNLTKVTGFATTRATTTLPDTATMDNWASANTSAANDRVTRNYYNARNELRYTVGGEGHVVRTDYDAEGRETATVAWASSIAVSDSTTFAQVAGLATGASISTATTYDMAGRVASTVDGTGATTAYIYDATGGIVGKIDRASGTTDQSRTQFNYDTAGRILSRIDAAGTSGAATTSFAYDGLGNVLTTTDPLGNKILATYDRAGRQLTRTDQEGLRTSFQYNAFGDLVATTDPRGATSYAYYDTLGRVSRTRDAIGQVTATAYTVFGEVASMTRYANKASNTAAATALPVVTADAARDATVAYSYDKAGRLATKTDAESAATAMTYNAFGEVATRTDPLDARLIQTNFTYDRRGLVKTRVVDAAAGGKALTTTLGYDAFGRQVTLADGNNAVTTRTYDNEGRLTSSQDPLGNATSYAYDRRGNLAAVTDPGGAVTRYAYDKLDRRVYTVDPLGSVVQTVYDKLGNPVIVTEFAAPISLTGMAAVTTVSAIAARISADETQDRTTRAVYDSDSRLRYAVDGVGALTGYAYDGAGNVIATTAYETLLNPLGAYTVEEIGYAIGAWTAAEQAAVAITRDVYDAAGQRAFSIDALGFVTAYSYDSGGNVVATRRLATAYTAAGDPSDATMISWVAANPAVMDRTARAIYDRDDRLRFDVDAEGYVTQYLYDQADHLAQTVRYADRIYDIGATTTLAQALTLVGATPPATSQVTAFTYDSAGRLESKVLDPGTGRLNITTGHSYDAASNLVAVTDALGQVTRYVYDAAGRRTFAVDAEGGVTKTSYDTLGRVVAVREYATKIARATLDGYPKAITAAQADVAATAADRVTRTLYDADGRQVYAVDGEGYVTEQRFDGLDNVVGTVRYAAKVAADDTVTRASLAALLPATIPDTAIVTGYSYDLAGRVTRMVEDQGGGKLNIATGYVYDAGGNVAAVTDALGRVTRYAYDKLDRQSWAVDAAGYATERRYDAFGGLRATIGYANRVADAATLASWPLQADAAQLSAGVVASADDRIARTFFDRNGREAYAVDGEGFLSETHHDAVGNVVTTIRHNARVTTSDTTNAADIAAFLGGNVTTIDPAITSYAYDRANRLTDTTDATGSVTHFELDALGQIVATTRAFGTADAATVTRAFDRAGRMILETRPAGTGAPSATAYGYNAFDEATTITDANAGVTRREFDALGRVVREYVPVDTLAGHDLLTATAYDAFGRVVQVTDPNGNSGYFHYDNLDRLTVQVDPEGYVTQTSYTVTGAKESVTRYAERATAPGSATAMPTVTSGPRDAITVFGYDRLDRLVSITDAQGYVERYALNAFGDRAAVVNKLGGVVFSTFDRRGLTIAETTQIRWVDPAQNLPMGSNVTNTFEYDGRGNLTIKVEAFARPEARTTRYAYDGVDRLTSVTHDTVEVLADPVAGTLAQVTPVERSHYDLRGNLIESIDAAGARTLYFYDGQDRKIAEINAVGTLSTWHYDGNGNALVQRVYGDPVALPAVAGGTAPAPVAPANVRETAYSYDRNNRLVATIVANVTVRRFDGATFQTLQGITTTLAYDGLGNVVRETDGNGAPVFHYFDKLGREIAKVDAESYLTTWQRDAEGNVTLERRYANRTTGTIDQTTTPATLLANTVDDPANDRLTAFTYNRNGQRTQQIRFGVAGLMDGSTGTVLGNADAVIRYTYNALGEVLSKREATGDATHYTYDDAGRLVRRQDAAIASLGGLRHTTDFAYDGLDSLIGTRESAAANTSAPDAPEEPAAPLPAVAKPITTNTMGAESADGYSVVTGTAANDRIVIPASAGANYGIVGGAGDDWLIIESSNSQMDGGDGNDVLEFRAMTATGLGGAGADIFVFDVGNLVAEQWQFDPGERWATINDFTPGVDKIAILNHVRSFADLTLTQTGNDVKVTMAGAPSIRLKNVSAASLSASDFVINRGADAPTRTTGDFVRDPITANIVSPANDRWIGTGASDLAYASASLNSAVLYGGDGDDRLITDSWQSLVSGGDGNDLIEVRNENAIIIGGGGNDTLVFDLAKYAGEDWTRSPDYVWARVKGFTSGHDSIVIPGRSYAELTFTQVGANVEISMPGAPRIILELAALAEIQPSDFVFPGTDASVAAPVLTAPPATGSVALASGDRATVFTYGAGGRLLSQTDASGFTHRFVYDAVGRLVRDSYDRELSSGTRVTEGKFTSYDALGRTQGQYAASLSGGTWLSGDVSSTTYDAYGDTVARSINGQVQEIMLHDTLGRVVKSNGGDGAWREYSYDGNGNIAVTVASNGFATSSASVGDLTARGLSGAADVTVTYNSYDRRNLATASYELARTVGISAPGTGDMWNITRTRTHNAFGEVVSETDPESVTTTYRYNTMGRMVERVRARVSVTDEQGVLSSVTPTDRYYYDVSGRMVGMDDANGRRSSRTLFEGSGYGEDGGESDGALVAIERRADGSTKTTEYTVFGDAKATIDGLGQRTEQTFDKMGRLTSATRPASASGAQLTDYYAYDGLGQRIRQANSYYHTPVPGQTYPFYDEDAGGTFYMSPSGPYLVPGDTGGADGTNGGMIPPTTYPSPGPGGSTWTYDPGTGHPRLSIDEYETFPTDGTGNVNQRIDVDEPTEPGGPGEGGGGGGGGGGGTGGGFDPGVGNGYASGLQTTDYDAQGRVVSTTNYAGDLTAYSYSWNSALTAGLGVSGGWIRTVSTIADRAGIGAVAATDSTDAFGHLIARTDMGGVSYSYSFDLAGRSVTETASNGRTVTNSYYNTGLLAGVIDSAGGGGTGLVSAYSYDVRGNRIVERLTTGAGAVLQDGYSTYDTLSRMTSYRDQASDGGPHNVSLQWTYDAVGNIRAMTQRYRPMDNGGLSTLTTTETTAWYVYDTMDRVVISQGALVGNTIVRGWGVELTYDAAGQRKTATTAAAQGTPGYAAPGSGLPDPAAGAHRELYDYSADGQLIAVTAAEADATGIFGPARTVATYTRDVMGRTTAEYNYDAAGQIARSRTGIVYDNRDQVLSESDSQRQGSEVHLSQTGNYYGAGGVLTSTSSYASIQGQSNSATNDTTTYTYQWRDGPLTSQAVLTNKNGTTSSTYGYDGAGRLTSVALTGGQRPRTITLTTDLAGQILTRVESSAASLNPDARSYFFAGVQMGSVSNDGTDNTTFAAAIAEATVAPPASNPGPFRGGATYGSSYASFDRQHDAVNPNNATSAQSSYTVKTGDTLASVARALWGDANLWYLLAAANGLSGAEELAAGRTLNVPNKTINRANTSDTFRPYDPNDALGDVQPNTPTPKPQGKKKNKCGIFGAILLAIVAIAVAAVLTPVFSAALGGGLGGAIFGGAAAAAVGSVASQGVGLATGIQDKFSFKQVALSALGAGVSAGVGSVVGNVGSKLATDVLRGVISNVATQGVAVATGLQKKFSWTAVAVAGVASGAIGVANRTLAAAGVGVAAANITDSTPRNVGFYANQGLSGLAGSIAGAATRSIANGSSFGDNIIATLPDVIASTIGGFIGDQVNQATIKARRISAYADEFAKANDITDPAALKEVRTLAKDTIRASDDYQRPRAANETEAQYLARRKAALITIDRGKTTVARLVTKGTATEAQIREIVASGSTGYNPDDYSASNIRVTSVEYDGEEIVVTGRRIEQLAENEAGPAALGLKVVDRAVGTVGDKAVKIGAVIDERPYLKYGLAVAGYVADAATLYFGGPAKFFIGQAIGQAVGSGVERIASATASRYDSVGYDPSKSALGGAGAATLIQLGISSRDIVGVVRSLPRLVTNLAKAFRRPSRPSWQASEAHVEQLVQNEGYRRQVSYKDGREVAYGTKGSVRPELYKPGSSIEVKNYSVETTKGRSNLVRDVSRQVISREQNLPEGTAQSVFIDVRGQSLSRPVLKLLVQDIVRNSNGIISSENIKIVR